jgi:predicted nucleic acid-binding protein
VKVALDTSVLVAALWIEHRDHVAARPWVLPGEDTDLARCICAHALAETWSVLTRLPVRPLISPAAAEAMMTQLAAAVEVVAVTSELQQGAIKRCASRGLVGGAVHDALHLVAAEFAGADVVATFNRRHFERLRNPESPEVRVPGSAR